MNETFVVGGVAKVLSLPAGPYLRVEVIVPENDRIEIGSAGAFAGAFFFQRQGTQTIIAVAGLKAWVGAGTSPTLKDGEGVLVLQTDGFAGYVTGKVAVDTGAVQLGGSVLLRVSTIRAGIDQTVSFGGRDLVVSFPASTADIFAVSVTGASINIANVVTVDGNVSFETKTLAGLGSVEVFAGSGLKVFFGDGPATTDDGSPNPLARGILLSDATIGVIRSASGEYAFDARGTIQVLGFPGLTFSGEVRVRVNSFGVTIDQTLTIPGTDGDVVVKFSDSEKKTAAGQPFATVRGLGLQLAVLGQTLSGDFSFTRSAEGLRIGAANVQLSLGDGATPVVQLTNGVGELLVTSTGLAGGFGGTVALNVPGVQVAGTFDLLVNTTPTAVAGPFALSGGRSIASIPAGPYLKLTGTGVSLTIAGQTLSGDFSIERSTTGSATVTRITASNVSLSLGDGTTTYLSLRQGEGSLLVTAAGLAGRISADVQTSNVPGFALSGRLSIAVNTTSAAAEGLPAGPYLRVEALGVTAAFLGQTLTGDFAFERTTKATAAGTTPVVRIGATNVAFALTAGGQPVVSLTGGTGLMLLAGTGIAADLTGTITVAIPGVGLTGTLRLQLNTTGAAVSEVLRVGTTDLELRVPAPATAGTQYLRLTGTGLSLDVLGQQLSGDVTFARDGATTTISVANGALSIGGGLVQMANVSANLTIAAGGTFGDFSGKVTLGVPGVAFAASATLKVVIDTRPATQKLRVETTTPVDLTIAGQTLRGDFVLERSVDGGGVKIAVANVQLNLGTFVTISGASGQFVIAPDGVAGQVNAKASVNLAGLMTASNVDVAVQVNTRPQPVNETFEVGGTTATLTLPAGPFLRVRIVVPDATPLTVLTGRLSGTLLVEQAGGQTIVAVTGLKAYLDADATPEITNGEGAFIASPGGVAGVAGFVSGTVAVGAGGAVSVSGEVLLRLNTTAGAVDQTVSVGSRTLVVKFATGNVIEVAVSNARITIADFISIEGSVSFTDGAVPGTQVFAGENLTIFLGRGPLKLDDGTTNPLATGVALTNGRIGLIKNTAAGTYAVVAEGTVSLVGIPGITIAGTVNVRVNTLGTAVDQTLTIPGSTGSGIQVKFTDGLTVKRFEVTNAQISILGQSLTGNLLFDRSASGDVQVAASNLGLSLGGVTVSDGTGAFLLTAAGAAAQVSAKVKIPNVFEGDLALAINTTAASVSRTLSVGGQTIVVDLPAGPYLRLEGTQLALTFAGQSLTADIAVERRTTTGGATVTTIALANVGLVLTAGSTEIARLSGGEGALILGPTGVAGRLSGQVALSLPAGVSFTGSVSVAVNTTLAAVDQTLNVGTGTVRVAVPAGPYVRFEGTGLQLNVLGQQLSGDVAIERATALGTDGVPGGQGLAADRQVVRVALANVSLAFGGATPILTVTNGSGALLLDGTGAAGSFQGTLALNVPSVSLAGTLAVQINTTGTAVKETLKVGTTTVDLDLPNGPYLQVAGTGITLTVLGQSLAGDVTFTRSTSPAGVVTTRIKLNNVKLRLGGTAAAPIVAVDQTNGPAEFVISPAGVAGAINATLAVNLPGISFTVPTGQFFEVAVNTTTVAQTVGSTSLPAGPYLRVGASGATLTVLGQTIQGAFAFEQLTTATGQRVVRVGATGLSASFAGAVSLSNGTGFFVIAPDGVAGRLQVTAALTVPGVSLGGTFELELNTTAAAVAQTLQVGTGTVSLALPAGPYLRVAGTGVSLIVAGQTLSGDFSFERVTTTSGQQRVRIAATNVALSIGDGTKTFVQLTNGEGLFLLSGTTVAARVSATAVLQNIPAVSFSGTLAFELNTSLTEDVDEEFVVAGLPRRLTVKKDTLAVQGTDISLSVLGAVTLSGDFTFKKTTGKVEITLSDVDLALSAGGADLVKVTEGAGTLTLMTAKTQLSPVVMGGIVFGELTGTVTIQVPDVKFNAKLTVRINTGAETQAGIPAKSLRISGTGVKLTVAGQELEGNFVIERREPTPGQAFVSVAVSGVSFALKAGATTIVSANDIKGALLVTPLGIAAQFTATAPTFNLPGLGVVINTLELRVNTGPAAVTRTFTVELPNGTSETINLNVGAGPLLQVALTGAQVCVGGSGASCAGAILTFSGNFVFDQSSKPGFGAPSTIGQNGVALATVDVDGDGDLDVLVGGASSSQLLLNDGKGGFTGSTFGSGGAKALAFADVDGDGDPDAIVAGETTKIFLNNGTVATSLTAAAAQSATTLTVGSVAGLKTTNGTVRVGDITVTYTAISGLQLTGVSGVTKPLIAGTPVRQWQGFAATTVDLSTAGANSVATGDVDGDGLVDIVVGAGSGGVMVFRNRGVATSTLAADLGPNATTIALQQLAGFPSPSGTVTIGGTETVSYTGTNAGTRSLTGATRTNGIAHLAGETVVTSWLRFLGAESPTVNGTVIGVALGDVDDDGDLDLLATVADGAHQLLLNKGRATTTLRAGVDASVTELPVASVSGFATTNGTLTIGTEQLTYTGVDTTADAEKFTGVTRAANQTVAVAHDANASVTSSWLNFAAATTVTSGNNVVALALGDVDGDDDLDIVVVRSGAVSQLLKNQGYGADTTWDAFAAATTLATLPAAPTSTGVALADIDGDGRLDVFVTRSGANAPLMYLNRGVDVAGAWLGFKDGVDAAAATGGANDNGAILVANVDEDTDLDLILTSATNGTRLVRSEPERVTRIGFSAVTVSLTPSTGAGTEPQPGEAEPDPLSISQGQGAFILPASGGVAGSFSGKIDAAVDPFSANITVTVRFNSTGKTFDETIVVGGISVPIKFGAGETGSAATPFIAVSGSGIIRFGNFVEVAAGAINFTGGGIKTIDNVTIFIGQGPGFLDAPEGSPAGTVVLNPDAVGLYVEVVTGKAIQVGETSAIYAKGNVRLVGIPGLSFTAENFVVKFNDTLDPQFSGDQLVAAGERSASGVVKLEVAGQTLEGGFSFSKDPNTLVTTIGLGANATPVVLKLGDTPEGGQPPVKVTITTGEPRDRAHRRLRPLLRRRSRRLGPERHLRHRQLGARVQHDAEPAAGRHEPERLHAAGQLGPRAARHEREPAEAPHRRPGDQRRLRLRAGPGRAGSGHAGRAAEGRPHRHPRRRALRRRQGQRPEPGDPHRRHRHLPEERQRLLRRLPGRPRRAPERRDRGPHTGRSVHVQRRVRHRGEHGRQGRQRDADRRRRRDHARPARRPVPADRGHRRPARLRRPADQR